MCMATFISPSFWPSYLLKPSSYPFFDPSYSSNSSPCPLSLAYFQHCTYWYQLPITMPTNNSSCLNPTFLLGLILNSSITVYTRRLMTTFLKECVLCNKSSRNGRMELTETLALCMINTEEAFVRIVMGKKTCTNVLMSHLRGSKRPQLHHFHAWPFSLMVLAQFIELIQSIMQFLGVRLNLLILYHMLPINSFWCKFEELSRRATWHKPSSKGFNDAVKWIRGWWLITYGWWRTWLQGLWIWVWLLLQ